MGTTHSAAPPGLVIVGAGPAGLMAAIAAAEAGARVALCEQLPRPGTKLLATGGGRCNLTNAAAPDAIAAGFGRAARFMRPALDAMGPARIRQFFAGLGVPTHSADGFHYFPLSETAEDVRRALWRRCERLGVDLRLRTRATGLLIDGAAVAGVPAVRGVCTDRGDIPAPRVLIATGGRSYPRLGATGTGYQLAREAGHSIVEPVPALVPLILRETWPRTCAGATLPAARIWIDLPRHARTGRTGIVLVTHGGLSGPAVLDLSGDVSRLLAERGDVPLRLDLRPDLSAADWLALFDQWQRTSGRKMLRNLLDAWLPASLAAALCGLAGIARDARPADVTRARRLALADLLTRLPATVTGTEGFGKAIITRGGVSLREVDPRTLQSRLLAGLHFAGEILDLDGPCGGYNLTWAFASGRLAGQAAAGA